MGDRAFGEAYAKVRSGYTEQYWLSLSPREITSAIYREMRELDLERVRASSGDKSSQKIAAE